MKFIEIAAIVWLIVCTLVLLILHIKSNRMIKSIFFHATLGFSAVFLINITQRFTGVHIPLNWYTVGGSGVFGMPFVCGSLLLQVML